MPGKDFSLERMLTRNNSGAKEEHYGMLTILQGADSTSMTLELSPEAKFDANREHMRNECAANGLLCVQTFADVTDQDKQTRLYGYCIIPTNYEQTRQALKILFSCSSLSQMSSDEKNKITMNLLSKSPKQKATSNNTTPNSQSNSSSSNNATTAKQDQDANMFSRLKIGFLSEKPRSTNNKTKTGDRLLFDINQNTKSPLPSQPKPIFIGPSSIFFNGISEGNWDEVLKDQERDRVVDFVVALQKP
jgi:hypothetical protein